LSQNRIEALISPLLYCGFQCCLTRSLSMGRTPPPEMMGLCWYSLSHDDAVISFLRSSRKSRSFNSLNSGWPVRRSGLRASRQNSSFSAMAGYDTTLIFGSNCR
jgi:hypothetical protein